MLLFDPVDDLVSGCATAIDLGEVEDYCVEIIVDSLLCPLPVGLDTMDYQGTSTLVVWEEVDSAIAYVIRHRKVGDDEWMEVDSQRGRIQVQAKVSEWARARLSAGQPFLLHPPDCPV